MGKRLFYTPPKQFKIPPLECYKNETIFDQLELLGFPIELPFDMVEKRSNKYIKEKEMKKYLNKEITMIGYFISKKTVTTINKQLMYFGTFLDEDGTFLDTIHFPNEAYKYPFTGNGVYLLKGKVTVEFDFYSLKLKQIFALVLN